MSGRSPLSGLWWTSCGKKGLANSTTRCISSYVLEWYAESILFIRVTWQDISQSVVGFSRRAQERMTWDIIKRIDVVNCFVVQVGSKGDRNEILQVLSAKYFKYNDVRWDGGRHNGILAENSMWLYVHTNFGIEIVHVFSYFICPSFWPVLGCVLCLQILYLS